MNDDALIWLGGDYEKVVLMLAQQHTIPVPTTRQSDDDEDDNPVGLDVVGNVGVVSIEGGTISQSSWLSRMFGVASYPDIRARMLEAANDSNVKGVLLNISSGGGQAEGVGGLSRFIRQFNNGVKPVVSFTATKALSAAYWYGTAASKLIVDEDAETGSIGALAMHTDISEMRKQLGIKDTVFRTAPYKALGSPFEKLDKKTTDYIQEKLEGWHNRFVAGIAANRDLDEAKVRSGLANGKTYSADESIRLKMADSVMSFEQIVAKLNSAFDNKRAPVKP